MFGSISYAQTNRDIIEGQMEVGVARIDITPDSPIRLAGYGARSNKETEKIIHRLEAKALAFGSDAQEPSILITVDLLGIPGHITSILAESLSKKVGIDASRIAICASHTHGAPEVGNAINILMYREGGIYGDSLLARDHLAHLSQYTEQLKQKLEQVSLEALKNRIPANVAWGQGQVGFAKNRRTPGGPVDVALPILRIQRSDGTLLAVLVNYACHGTTLSGISEINGDWISEAKKAIEARHPEAVAMVAIGCGADANPHLRGELEHMELHGKEIADQVDKLLTAQLQPLTVPPVAQIKRVTLPFAHVPTVQELIQQSYDSTVVGYCARLALDRIARGISLPSGVSYPVQVWTFGDKMAMVNLPGEVVVDYSLRLKEELGAEVLWINAYANDAPSYISSRRVLAEGGYEPVSSMYYYDKLSPYKPEIEDIIVQAVHDLLPTNFKLQRAPINEQKLVEVNPDGVLLLLAEHAKGIGPEIKYMPEWKAFGWFTTADRAEWEVKVNNKGMYNVYLEWSVADNSAGKAISFEVDKKRTVSKVERTGSWFTYRTEKIGEIWLKKGTQKMVFRSGSHTEKGAMLDLRKIVLKPQ